MSITVSIHFGTTSKVNIKHNLNVENYRDGLSFEDGRRVNHDRSHENIVLVNRYDTNVSFRKNVINLLGEENIQAIENILANYNAGQRASRQIKFADLFNEKRKQHFEHCEALIQFGGTDCDPIDEKEHVQMYKEALKKFSERMPFAFITSVVIHLDETTPHMHITYIPLQVNPERKKGVALNMALTACAGGKQRDFCALRSNLEKDLDGIAIERGYEVIHPRIKGPHVDQREYNKIREERERLNRDRARLESDRLAMEQSLRNSQAALYERENRLNEREEAIEEKERHPSFKKLLNFYEKVSDVLSKAARKFGMDPLREDERDYSQTLAIIDKLIDRSKERSNEREIERKGDFW